MIEFSGNLTGDCKKFLLKKQMKFELLVSTIIFVLYSVPVILVSVYWRIEALLFIIVLLLFPIGSVFSLTKSSQKLFMPQRIFLDLEENTIVHKCEKMERFHMIDSVETVIDYGDWYHLLFNFEDRDTYFVCQKNLLTKGTLEEFEALFDGKIERRLAKK